MTCETTWLWLPVSDIGKRIWAPWICHIRDWREADWKSILNVGLITQLASLLPKCWLPHNYWINLKHFINCYRYLTFSVCIHIHISKIYMYYIAHYLFIYSPEYKTRKLISKHTNYCTFDTTSILTRSSKPPVYWSDTILNLT